MKKIRFEQVLSFAWYNVSEDAIAIRSLMFKYTDGNIAAAKARRMYKELRKAFDIDAARLTKIYNAAAAYDPEKFADRTLEHIAGLDLEFTEFFEN